MYMLSTYLGSGDTCASLELVWQYLLRKVPPPYIVSRLRKHYATRPPLTSPQKVVIRATLIVVSGPPPASPFGAARSWAKQNREPCLRYSPRWFLSCPSTFGVRHFST